MGEAGRRVARLGSLTDLLRLTSSGGGAMPGGARSREAGALLQLEEARAEFRGFLENMTLLKRLPSPADVTETAVFLASDGSAAMTATVVNRTGGMSVD